MKERGVRSNAPDLSWQEVGQEGSYSDHGRLCEAGIEVHPHLPFSPRWECMAQLALRCCFSPTPERELPIHGGRPTVAAAAAAAAASARKCSSGTGVSVGPARQDEGGCPQYPLPDAAETRCRSR